MHKFVKCIGKCDKRGQANFKIPLTPKNWLLKFDLAYCLAKILEPKLLVHKILKFKVGFLE